MSTLKTNAITTVAGKPILNSTGSILQVAYAENTTPFSSSTIQTYQVFYSQTIAAASTNSRYLLIGNTHVYSGTVSLRANIGYSVTIGGITTRILGVDGSSGDSWGNTTNNGLTINRQAIYTSSVSAGTSLTFNFLVGHFDAGTAQYNTTGYNHKSTFTVLEISA